ncbi:hypothetical protein FHR70_000767 [Microvirga lupini]|uniref:Uncharacterized protein n=1 Tax=Microvirga lupini TaxID=420324 RepID=A0A7W4VIH2_9HYPH|nr:hypothetical protein [Microvirga lupini]MBB3017727.1 hypothetical protein [Microvirga lupini]
MIDDRTPALQLPLPHADNYLDDDVARLREAFTSLDELLASDDPALSSIQELVDAIKENASNIMTLREDAEEVQTLAADQTVVNLNSLTDTTGCTVFIEGVRLNKNQWTRDPAVMTRFTLTQSYSAPMVITIVRRQGGV